MFMRTRKVNRPQPPSKPRYIAVAMAAGMFAIVPVSHAVSERPRSEARQGMTREASAGSHVAQAGDEEGRAGRA